MFSHFFHSLRYNKETQLIAGLFVLNMLVKLVPVFRGIMIHPDAPVYLWSAQSLAAGDLQGAIAAYPMLFYPFLIMLVNKMGIDWLWAGRLISLTASCLALLPFMAIARRFVTGWPWVVGALLFIFLAEFSTIGYTVLRDPFYLFLSLSALYYALRFTEERSLSLFWLATLVALVLPFVRLEGAFTTLLICVMCLFLLWKQMSGRKLVLIVLLLCSGMLLVGLLFSETLINLVKLKIFYQYYVKLVTGELTVQACLAALDTVSHSLPAATNGSNFWQVIERHWPWIYFIGTLYAFVDIVGWPVLILGIVGLAIVLLRGDGRQRFMAVLFVGHTALVLLFYLLRGYLEVRYLLFPSLLLLLFSLGVMAPFSDMLYEKSQMFFRQKKGMLIVLFAALLVFPPAYNTFSHKYRIHVPVLQEAALWLKNELIEKESDPWFMAANARRMAWFLDRPDMRYVKKLDGGHIDRHFSRKHSGAVLFVLLLNKRVPQDMALLENLTKQYSSTSKVFTADGRDKYVTVAVWRLAEEK